MDFKERSYGGKIFRPQPEVLFDQEGGLLLVTTPWGPRALAKKVNSLIRDQFFSAQADAEATSPFDRLTCISSLANDLRIALKLANDTIYNEDNRDEYIFGFEIIALVATKTEFTWTQVGFPSVFIDRANSCLTPLGTSCDLSTEFGHPLDPTAPLPSELLGIDPTSDFHMRTLRPQADERLIFISRSFLPQSLFELPYGGRSLENISKCFSQDNENTPFWVGEFSSSN